jgi:hypothetical protein
VAFALPFVPSNENDDDDGPGVLFRFSTTSSFDLVYKGARGLGICRTMGWAGRIFTDGRPRSDGAMVRSESHLDVTQDCLQGQEKRDEAQCVSGSECHVRLFL